MKSQSWTEEARFEPAHRAPQEARPLGRQRQHVYDESNDPFESVASSASHSLEPGWLFATSPPPPFDAPQPSRAARTWKQRAVALGGRLLDAERRATARLRSPRYPLVGTRHLSGLPTEERARLARAFRDATPPRDWGSRAAALAHLQALLPAWPLGEISQIRGVHVFLGTAGAGKTTLALKVAHQLTRAGRRVGFIALYPRSPERIAALREAALRVPAPVRLAHDEEQLDEAARALAACDAILIDTPCLLSQPARSRQIARLRLLQHPATVLHFSLCLHHARSFRRRELAAAAAHRVDFLALSHVDLAPGPGPLIAVQLHTPRRISLVNADPDVNEPLVPLGAAALLRALGGSRAD